MSAAVSAGERWGLRRRHLYLCTPDRPDLARFVVSCIEGGVDIVQLRDKTLTDKETLRAARVVRRVCADHGVPFILNDRPDLAAEAGADGVHVGQDDLAPAAARGLVGEYAIVGLSTHSHADLDAVMGGGLAQATDAATEPTLSSGAHPHGAGPVDYVSAGPVVATPTKPGRPGTGLAYVREAAWRAPWPVWVTGGVDPGAVPAMVAAGARHFVAVRWLTDAENPREHARALRRSIDDAIECAGSRAG